MTHVNKVYIAKQVNSNKYLIKFVKSLQHMNSILSKTQMKMILFLNCLNKIILNCAVKVFPYLAQSINLYIRQCSVNAAQHVALIWLLMYACRF